MSPLYLHNGKLLIKDGALAINENCCCSGCDISDTILCLNITSEHKIYNYTCPPNLDFSSCDPFTRDCVCGVLVSNCDYEEEVIQANLKLYVARVNMVTGLLDPDASFNVAVLTDKGNGNFAGNPPHVLPLNVMNRGGGIVYGSSNGIVQCGIIAPGWLGNILNVDFVSIDKHGCIVNVMNGVDLYGCSSGPVDGSHCFGGVGIGVPLFPGYGGDGGIPYLWPFDNPCTNYQPGYYDANGNLIANINACFDPPDIQGTSICQHYYTSAGLVSLRFSLPCWEGLGEAPANRVSATVTAPIDNPGPISAITMGPKGNNYAKIGRVAPTLTVSGGSGSGLTVTPTLLETKDSCNVPTWSIGSVSFKGGTGYVGGENLTVTAAIGDTTVTNAVLTVQTATRSEPSLSASVTPGTGSSLSVNMISNNDFPATWRVNGVSVSGNGTGYEDNSPVIFSYGNGVVEQIPAAAYIRTNRSEPTVSANATGGNGAVLSVNLGSFFPQPDTFWVVSSVTVNNGGTGYSDGDPVNFVVTDGIQVGQATGFVVTAKSIEPRENPNLTPYIWGFEGTPAGNGAILTATMTETVDGENKPAWTVSSINIIDGGSGYQVGEYIWYNEYPGFGDNPPYYILAFDGYVITGVDGNGAITGIGLDPMIGGTGLYYKQQEGTSTGVIESITMTNWGNYYKPTSSIWGVIVTNAGKYYYYTGTPTGVTIVNAGQYYREDNSIPGIPSPVTITINQLPPSNGNGAQLSAIIDTNANSADFGKITGVNIINGGDGYLAGESNQPGGAFRSTTTISATLTSFSPDPSEYSIIEPPDNSGPLLSPTPCE